MTIEEAFVELENYIDASDPDMDLVRNKCNLHMVLLPFIHALIFCLTSSPPYLLLIDVYGHITKPTLINSQIYSIYSKLQRVSDKPINQIGSN